jgi:zinc transport system substrate-binding protein
MKHVRLTVATFLGLSFLIGGEPHGYADKVPIFVSIVPQKYFVEKIGGDLVDVSVMVEPGASPHDYEPKPQQMAALAKAKIYYAVGIEFESAWLEKLLGVNREVLIVHTDRGIEKIPFKPSHPPEPEEKDGPERAEDKYRKASQGHGGKRPHVHGIKDPHIWTSPATVMVQARHILTGLLVSDPGHRSTYEANYKEFIMELVDLDADLRGVFSNKGERIEFMVFHPAWGYFADAYGLEQVPVEIEGKDPKPAELQHLIHHAKSGGSK